MTSTDSSFRARRVQDVSALIGNTPLLQIAARVRGRDVYVYAKYEQENMTGSVKDRMALRILEAAREAGDLKPGDRIVEASSGNTGISFAAIGRALGHSVRIYMPDWMSQERVQLIASLGADVVPVSRVEGGFVGSIKSAEQYAAKHEHVFLPRQFQNPLNVDAHERSTGPEIDTQLALFGVTPDAFVAGVGTGGTVMGVGRYLRDKHMSCRVHPLEPSNSPTLRTGTCVGSHRIQGISDEFIPQIVELDALDAIVDVWDGDAILMAQALSKELGLAVGISSGANLLGAFQLALEMGSKATVVTLFPDSNKKYLSTDLCQREPKRDDYLFPDVELLGFRAVRT